MKETTKAPISGLKSSSRQNWPEWARQLPRFRFLPLNENFELIDRARLRSEISSADAEVAKLIEDDLDFLERELLRLFRDRDYEASQQQNRHRLYQVAFGLLAMLAAMFGA